MSLSDCQLESLKVSGNIDLPSTATAIVNIVAPGNSPDLLGLKGPSLPLVEFIARFKHGRRPEAESATLRPHAQGRRAFGTPCAALYEFDLISHAHELRT